MIKIGIDPGKDTGFAVVKNGNIEIMKTVTFWEAYANVSYFHAEKEEMEVFIEVPKTKTCWHGRSGPGYFNKKQVSGIKVTASNVGRVCREAELLADGIEALGVKVTRVHPQGKVDKEKFKKITGYVGRSNQHCRDAAMLAYNR